MMWFSCVNSDKEMPHSYETEALEEAERILGPWAECMPEILEARTKGRADMERLTNCRTLRSGVDLWEAVNRLAAIEDILGDEYDLDRLRELKQADDEGRCVVLPCKVGETVYTTRWFDTFWETCTDSRGELFRRKQFQHKVTKEKFSPFSLDYTGFGKTVFLTYEEAEAALEG